MSDLRQSLTMSLWIASLATAVVTVLGVSLAFLLARRTFPGKSLIEALLIAPLVLPPTVVGYGLIVLLGRRGLLGGPLWRITGGYQIMFRPEAGVIAAAVVSLPLLYLPVKTAFGSIDRDLLDTAKLMGAGRWSSLWHVQLPLARRGIFSGVALAFGRALGEFGATTMVMGNMAGQQTLPIWIYSQTLNGSMHAAGLACAVLGCLSLAVVLFYNHHMQDV